MSERYDWPGDCLHPECDGSVRRLEATSTLMYCEYATDEEQAASHIHDGNTLTLRYFCSRGHHWSVNFKGKPCPVCGPEWMKEAPDNGV